MRKNYSFSSNEMLHLGQFWLLDDITANDLPLLIMDDKLALHLGHRR